MQNADYLALYTQLGRLIETAPDLKSRPEYDSQAGMLWLGRGDALLSALNRTAELIQYRSGVRALKDGVYGDAPRQIMLSLYNGLAYCEMHAPPAAAGTFIPVGSSFDAFSALTKILHTAVSSVMIVDPYMDAIALADFGILVPEGVSLRVLTDAQYKQSLIPAAKKWAEQYGTLRPLDIKISRPRSLHDRAIIVDGSRAWTLTQSLKDFAKRSPAEIIRLDEIAQLKIEANEQLWMDASALE